MQDKQKDLWIFAYGSLMWNPGFEYSESQRAKILGAHRSLCVKSIHHRGTPEKPGLVLGLDKGGSCKGIAFRISDKTSTKTLEYLREREQVTNVYTEAQRTIILEDGSKQQALCFLVNRSHPQYAGKLELSAMLQIIEPAKGISGDNISYILSTADHLKNLRITDRTLHRLARLIRQ